MNKNDFFHTIPSMYICEVSHKNVNGPRDDETSTTWCRKPAAYEMRSSARARYRAKFHRSPPSLICQGHYDLMFAENDFSVIESIRNN